MRINYAIRLFKVLLLLSVLCSNASFAQNKYEKQLNIIFETFTTKNFQLLNPILKQNLPYLNLKDKNELEALAAQVCLVPSPESYRIVETESIGNTERVQVEYQYFNKVRIHYFTFGSKGKLIAIEVVPSKVVCL